MNTLEKEFVPYQPSLDMKELGFDEPCLALITPNGTLEPIDMEDWEKISGTISAPLKQQAFKFFREKYEYYYHIFPLQINVSDQTGYRYSWEIYNHTPEWIIEDGSLLGSLTYEEAELACLIKLIEIVKENKQ